MFHCTRFSWRCCWGEELRPSDGQVCILQGLRQNGVTFHDMLVSDVANDGFDVVALNSRSKHVEEGVFKVRKGKVDLKAYEF